MRWPFTRYGTGTLLLLSAILLGLAAALSAWADPPAWGLAPLPLWLFVLAFFRDPERQAPGDENQLVAPADGLVSDVVQLVDPALGVPCARIGIFLSVFDVHVNRSPCSGEVIAVQQRPGGYHDARDPRAVDENRAATIVLSRPDGRRLAVRQITGLIARRIICPATVGQRLARGERYGMIRFGSRTELVVPVEHVARVLVRPGQRARGGETLLAELQPAQADAEAGRRTPSEAASPT
jgi:phosphatidylserine decarboxylase